MTVLRSETSFCFFVSDITFVRMSLLFLYQAITGSWAVPCRELMSKVDSQPEAILVAIFYVRFPPKTVFNNARAHKALIHYSLLSCLRGLAILMLQVSFMLIVSLVLIQVVITGKKFKIPVTKSQLKYFFQPKYLLHLHIIIAFSLEFLPP